jgi:membrane fusion protein (multidrug efflux system)
VKRYLVAASLFLLITACSGPDTRVETTVEVPVAVKEVDLKPIEEFVVTTGTTMATKDALLKSEASGYYRLAVNPQSSRLFALGDKVKKDQMIVYLDNPEQESNIKIESFKLNQETMRREYEKQKSIYEKGGVTERDLKTAERNMIDAKYSYENAKIQLTKLRICAPFDGIIIDLPYYTQGVKIPSNTDIVHIMNYSLLNMEVNLPGNILGKVTADQPVRVMNYTLPDVKLNGKITQVSPALDPSTRTFKATVDIDNPDWLLRPGMFVKAEIITAHRDSAIVIPKDIILTRQNRKIVFVVDRGIAEERTITIGLENPDELEAVEGLKVKERLIISGFETLRNRSKVKITQ